MKIDSKVFCLIPARAGSKGLPGKNLISVLNKPLIQWTIEQAKHSNLVNEVFVSTDSEEIASLALSLGASVPFLRPKKISRDSTSSIEVINHFLRKLGLYNSLNNNLILLAEPTSPIRTNQDFDNLISSFLKKKDKFDSAISMGLCKESPLIMHQVLNSKIRPIMAISDFHVRRQDFSKYFYPYGGLYLSKISSFVLNQTFYTERCMAYFVDDYQCYEIDDKIDLLCVEEIMKWKEYR